VEFVIYCVEKHSKGAGVA